MSRDLVTRREGRILLLRQSQNDPSEQEWDECIRLLTKKARDSGETVCVLVVTDGGSPSADQRKRLGRALKLVPTRVAVCTDSIRTRFVVSSVALLVSTIRAFSPSEIGKAFDHLGLDARERQLAVEHLKEMTREVDGVALAISLDRAG